MWNFIWHYLFVKYFDMQTKLTLKMVFHPIACVYLSLMIQFIYSKQASYVNCSLKTFLCNTFKVSGYLFYRIKELKRSLIVFYKGLLYLVVNVNKVLSAVWNSRESYFRERSHVKVPANTNTITYIFAILK